MRCVVRSVREQCLYRDAKTFSDLLPKRTFPGVSDGVALKAGKTSSSKGKACCFSLDLKHIFYDTSPETVPTHLIHKD